MKENGRFNGHAEYNKLQQGSEVSLAQIVSENPMLQFTVFQEVNLGSVIMTGVEVNEEGKLTDVRLVKIMEPPPRELDRTIFEQ